MWRFGAREARPAGTPTREDVLWCYRMFLDREPESEAVVTEHLRNGDFDALVRVFIDGPEFRERYAATVVRHSEGIWPADRVRLDTPALRIDTRADAAQMAQFIARTRDAWSTLGETQAHYSVLTAPKFLPENLADAMADFAATGASDTRDVLAMLRRHGVDDTRRLACVEFGCGVGRMTLPLAAAFHSVTGYDISAAHLAHAAAQLRETDTQNVRLVHCAANILEPFAACDVFFSVIVLQHNPPPVIRAVLDNALAALRPGGLAVFQVPTHILGYEFRSDLYLARAPQPGMEMHCLPQREIFALASERGCEVLEVREDLWTGRLDAFVSNTFILRRPPAAPG